MESCIETIYERRPATITSNAQYLINKSRLRNLEHIKLSLLSHEHSDFSEACRGWY